MAELYLPRIVSETVPEFHSDLFVGHENARFAVGQIADGDRILLGDENLAYHQLRANVYIKQEKMLTEDYIAPDGGEYDSDDARSVHMAVLENCGDTQRLIASLRLISRGDNEPLPIEELFPDVFTAEPVPATSCEVSRYIVRHEERPVQNQMSWALFQQGIATAITRRFGPMYAVIDPPLARIMRMRDVPITELAPAAPIEKYNSISQPVVIDIDAFAERLEDRTPGALSEMMDKQGEFTYFGERVPQIEVITLGEAALSAAAGE